MPYEESDTRSLVDLGVNRREFVGAAAIGGAAAAFPAVAMQRDSDGHAGTGKLACSLTINGEKHELEVDPRTTLLDLLRENLQLTGTKKGCDHGQCGACTVLVNGERINSCMTLAVMQDGHEITTVEGLAKGSELHPVQAAFIEHDGFQCGYCTPGQICSAVAMVKEFRAGAPSCATQDVRKLGALELTDDEIRERMSGNICRCGAYVGIVAAVKQAYEEMKA